MDQIMRQMDPPLATPDGRFFIARAWARQIDDGRWERWIEFHSSDGTPTLRTPSESELAERDDVETWVSGLREQDLQAALDLARQQQPVHGPSDTPSVSRPRAALDLIAASRQGEAALRDQLARASELQLRAVVRGNHWVDERVINLENVGRPVLEEMIVAAIRRRAASSLERERNAV